MAYMVQQAIVLHAVLLEIQAQVKKRLAQQAGVNQHQGYEQAANTPVAIQERVNSFELHMRQSCTHELRQSIVSGMEKALKSRHAVGDFGVGRRHEGGVLPGPVPPI